jgi:hypothetical protein
LEWLEQAAKQGRLASVLERIDYDGRREEALIFWRALLTEDQLRAELRSTGKQALVGFALGVAAAGTIDMTQAIADCVKQFQPADLLTVGPGRDCVRAGGAA